MTDKVAKKKRSKKKTSKKKTAKRSTTKKAEAKPTGDAPAGMGMREKVKKGYLTPQEALEWLEGVCKAEGTTPSEQAVKFLRNRINREGK